MFVCQQKNIGKKCSTPLFLRKKKKKLLIMSSTDTTSLSTLKIASGFLLALSAFLGSLVPELLLRSSKPGEFQSTILPIGNALSAGLLFGAGMLHFFAEGTSQLSAISMLASKGNKSEFTISSDEYVANIREGTGSGFTVAAPAMMMGYILSLVIDRVVLEKIETKQKVTRLVVSTFSLSWNTRSESEWTRFVS